MANAMVLGFVYNEPVGDTIVVTAETVVAGSDVAGGSVQTGVVFTVTPATDTPAVIQARVAAEVRAAATRAPRVDGAAGGVTIAANGIVMPGFTQG